jgi:signal transduction histidine kinase/CheY-like chemotaxis protein
MISGEVFFVSKANYLKNELLRQNAILARFGELALQSDNLDEILTESCRLVVEALGTDMAKVMELQEDGETLLVRAGVGWKPGVVGTATIKVTDDTSEGFALKTGEPMISPNVDTETRFRYPKFLIENGAKAVANVIIIGGKDRPPYGILQVDSREPREFTENDTAFLRSYANLLAATVDRFRVIQEVRDDATERFDLQERLRQAQKMEAIGQLTGGVAHDFNNLLAIIMGNLELLKDELESENIDIAETIEQIDAGIAAVVRGADLTRNMLAYARKARLKPVDTDLNRVVRETRTWIRRTIESNIEIRTLLSNDLWKIRVDQVSLQTALVNLLVNARDAVTGSGLLTIETGNAHFEGDCFHDQNGTVLIGDYVMLSVSDNGTGIEASDIQRMFDPFFTTKTVGKGSGLGLSMVQGFMEQSRGGIRVLSEPGQGTTIQLFFGAQSELMPSANDKAAEIPSASHDKIRSCRILLVEDQKEVLALERKILEIAGYNVTIAETGDAAFGIFENDPSFDLVLTDIVMPGDLQGISLAKACREVRLDIPFIFLSGYASETANNDNGSEPKDMRLMKPVSRVTLLKAIRDRLAAE